MKKRKMTIATVKSWNIFNAMRFREIYNEKYNVSILTKREELSYGRIKSFNPEYIFFPHWSWKIPKEIYETFKCVVFHMTDLPYGRGGSPLQNLILLKVYDTKISALRVREELDSGEIYMKENFHIGKGSAEEIFTKASEIIFSKMIPYILEKNPTPYEQKGKAIIFKRRTPEQSNIATSKIINLDDMYDFIRMLDAEGYPKAFLRVGALKILFSGVHRKGERLEGRFEIKDERE